MNPVSFSVEDLQLTAELTVIYLRDPSSAVVDSVFKVWDKHPEPLLKYFLLHPFRISKQLLEPQVSSNPLVASLTPPQTYLQFGSETLDIDRDIDSD